MKKSEKKEEAQLKIGQQEIQNLMTTCIGLYAIHRSLGDMPKTSESIVLVAGAVKSGLNAMCNDLEAIEGLGGLLASVKSKWLDVITKAVNLSEQEDTMADTDFKL